MDLSRSVDGGGRARVISYQIFGRTVCKSFYRDATGLRRQLFDAAVSAVEDGDGPLLKPVSIKDILGHNGMSTMEAMVIGFLDSYFTGMRVQYDPTKVDEKLMLYKTWTQLYDEDFTLYCDQIGVKQPSFSFFCRIHRLHRPQYKVNKAYRRKGIFT